MKGTEKNKAVDWRSVGDWAMMTALAAILLFCPLILGS